MSVNEEQAVFLALGDPTRRELLQALANQGDLTATELAAERPISRQGVSKHLNILAQAGLVTVTKDGRDKRYQLAPDPLEITINWITALNQQWDKRLEKLGQFLADSMDDHV